MAYKKEPGDVKWTIPNKKKPLAWSTIATEQLILTFMDAADTIQTLREKINYDVEAKHILDLYIEKGYGNELACDWFR